MTSSEIVLSVVKLLLEIVTISALMSQVRFADSDKILLLQTAM